MAFMQKDPDSDPPTALILRVHATLIPSGDDVRRRFARQKRGDTR
jgi:hypothetical protein